MSHSNSITFRENLKIWARKVNPLHLSEDYSREVIFSILTCTSAFIYLSLISYAN